MVKTFDPRDVVNTKTNIEPAKMNKRSANVDFLFRRTARDLRRIRRAL